MKENSVCIQVQRLVQKNDFKSLVPRKTTSLDEIDRIFRECKFCEAYRCTICDELLLEAGCRYCDGGEVRLGR